MFKKEDVERHSCMRKAGFQKSLNRGAGKGVGRKEGERSLRRPFGWFSSVGTNLHLFRQQESRRVRPSLQMDGI